MFSIKYSTFAFRAMAHMVYAYYSNDQFCPVYWINLLLPKAWLFVVSMCDEYFFFYLLMQKNENDQWHGINKKKKNSDASGH